MGRPILPDSVRKWSVLGDPGADGAPLASKSGISSRSETGSRTAPERLWAPNSALFSTTMTEASMGLPAALCGVEEVLEVDGVANPAGPPPTTSTSVSRTSRSGISL